ncbi:hypothetical protein [Glutamicibacter sp. TV12E]|uniref:hypothetical protein n=1 Tax=Glutamicibacter sp. TV12E TaxID=3446362 RepID=UPI0040331680
MKKILAVSAVALIVLTGCSKSDPEAGKDEARIACNQNISEKAPGNGIRTWDGESSTEEVVVDASDLVGPTGAADRVWQVRGTIPAGLAPWKSSEVLYQCNVHVTDDGEVVEVRDARIYS